MQVRRKRKLTMIKTIPRPATVLIVKVVVNVETTFDLYSAYNSIPRHVRERVACKACLLSPALLSNWRKGFAVIDTHICMIRVD